MKNILCSLLLLLFAGVAAKAQTTLVSGTITDSSSQAWANGTYSFTFLPSPINPTANYFQNGVPFNKNTTISGSLDGTGSLASVGVPDNLTITPGGSQWTVQVCPQATATNGCYRINLTITGSSQSITSAVIPPPIQVNVLLAPFFAAYRDSEITGARVGQSYWNLTDNTVHTCTQPACTWVSETTPPGVITYVAKVDLTGQTGNIGLTTFYTIPSGLAGRYRAGCYIVTTTAASASSTLPECVINYVDEDTGTDLSGNELALSAALTTANTVGATGCFNSNACVTVTGFQAKASTVVQYSMAGYASSGGTAMAYALHVTLEYLGQ